MARVRRALAPRRIAAAALAAAFPACADGPTGPAPEFAALDAYLASVGPSVTTDGVALVLDRGGRIVYAAGYGRLDPDRTVGVASGAKWLTAATVLALAGEGLVDLDEPIDRHLPAFAAGPDITLRQLLSHTSGIAPHDCRFDPATTLRTCADAIAATELVSPPGEEFAYGGTAYSVAGAVAEAAAGESWSEIFRWRILEPIGMTGTWYPGGDNHALGDVAESTARDYARFLRMIADDGRSAGRPILTSAMIAEMERDHTEGVAIRSSPRPPEIHYGLGVWRERVAEDGRALVLSSPGGSGIFPWVDRERDLVGVLVVNWGLEENWPVVVEVRRLVEEAIPPAAGRGVVR